MKIYKETILALAESQVGYCEKKSNTNLDEWTVNAGSGNFTKYQRDLDNAHFFNGNKQGYQWCTSFATWLFWMASGKDEFKTKHVLCIPTYEENLFAGCQFIREYFKAAGRYDANPQIGDLILFHTVADNTNSADHVGIVTDIGKDGKIYTTEGNKDNKVTQCAYPPDYYKILGYCHPKYDVADTTHKIKLDCDGYVLFSKEI